MVKVENLTFGYDRALLQDLNLVFPKGKVSAILGRNGAGKSTLLKCICGLLKPQQGSVRVGGEEVSTLGSRRLARKIAVVRQEAHYIFPYTVLDVVIMGRTPHLNFLNMPTRKDMDIAMRSLEMVDMASFADRKIQELSSGEGQLVLLARALCQGPSILLLDEPNVHLDIANQWKLFHLIARLGKSEGITIIAVLHVPEIAYWFADHVFMLERGRLVVSGEPDKAICDENLSRVYGLPMKTFKLGENYLATAPESFFTKDNA